MKTITTFFETVSITSVTYYIVMTIALSMLFVPGNDIAMAARISNSTHISLELMGIVIASGIVVSIINRKKWIKFLGIVPYLLFFAGVLGIAGEQGISLHVVLVYAGYGVQLLLTLRNGNNHVS